MAPRSKLKHSGRVLLPLRRRQLIAITVGFLIKFDHNHHVTVDAFQPELVVQAVSAAASGISSSTTAGAAPIDELLFVAANLLDASSRSQSRGPVPPPSVLMLNRRRAISPYVSFPEVYRPAPSPLSLGARRGSAGSAVAGAAAVGSAGGASGDKGRGDASSHQLYDYESPRLSRSLLLSSSEHDLFNLIRNVRAGYAPNTVVRVAGGWVRDKLLLGEAGAGVVGNNNNGGKVGGKRDVDLVLSNMSGCDFAALICRYLEEHGHSLDHDGSGQQYGTATTKAELGSNKGSQSHHLQTATLTLLNFSVDFARLRYERYDDTSSRIPSQTTDATIVQDAWRRDLTINSLYYNLNTDQVEDWTERGLQDLQLRTINTPRKPLPTLLEDPVRILRAIRFAAQLSFSVDRGLVRAARDVRVRKALKDKVSREAVGNEVDAMMGTRDPTRAIKLLMETNIIDLVLPLYDALEGEETTAAVADSLRNEDKGDDDALRRTSMYYAGLNLLARTQALVCRIFTQAPDWDVSKRRYLWYAAFLQPIYGTTAALAADLSKRGRRNGSGFYRLLAAGLKRPKCDIQAIETILKGVGILGVLLQTLGDEAVRDVVTSTSTTPFRDLKPTDSQWRQLSDLRWLWYKALKPIGPLWKEALVLALAAASNKGVISDAVDQFNQWVNFIENRLDLEDVVLDKDKLKPILNGSDVQRVLPGVSGNGFRRIMAAQEEWMVRNCMYSKTIVDDQSSSHNDDARTELIGYLAATFPEYATVVVER